MSVIFPIMPAVGGKALATVNWGQPLIVIAAPRALRFYSLEGEQLTFAVSDFIDAAASFRPPGAQQDWLAVLSPRSLRVITYENGEFKELYDSRANTRARMTIMEASEDTSLRQAFVSASPNQSSVLAYYGQPSAPYGSRSGEKGILLGIERTEINACVVNTEELIPKSFIWVDDNRILSIKKDGSLRFFHSSPEGLVAGETESVSIRLNSAAEEEQPVSKLCPGQESEVARVISDGKVWAVKDALPPMALNFAVTGIRDYTFVNETTFLLTDHGIYASREGHSLRKLSDRSGDIEFCAFTRDCVVVNELERVSAVKFDGTVNLVVQRSLPITALNYSRDEFKVVIATKQGSIIRNNRNGLPLRKVKAFDTWASAQQVFFRYDQLVIGQSDGTAVLDFELQSIKSDVVDCEPTLALTDSVQVTTRKVIGLRSVNVDLAVAAINGHQVFGARLTELYFIDTNSGYSYTEKAVEPVLAIAANGTTTAYAGHSVTIVNGRTFALPGVRQLAITGDCVVACSRTSVRVIYKGELQPKQLSVKLGLAVPISDNKCIVLAAEGRGAVVTSAESGFSALLVNGLPQARKAAYRDGVLAVLSENLSLWEVGASNRHNISDQNVPFKLFGPTFLKNGRIVGHTVDTSSRETNNYRRKVARAAGLVDILNGHHTIIPMGETEFDTLRITAVASVDTIKGPLALVCSGHKRGGVLALYDLNTHEVLDEVKVSESLFSKIEILRDSQSARSCRFLTYDSGALLWEILLEKQPKLSLVASPSTSTGYFGTDFIIDHQKGAMLDGGFLSFLTVLHGCPDDTGVALRYGWFTGSILRSAPTAALCGFSTGKLVQLGSDEKDLRFCEAATDFARGVDESEYFGSDLFMKLAPEVYFSTVEGGIYGYCRVDTELYNYLLKFPDCADRQGLIDASIVLRYCLGYRDRATELLDHKPQQVSELLYALGHWLAQGV